MLIKGSSDLYDRSCNAVSWRQFLLLKVGWGFCGDVELQTWNKGHGWWATGLFYAFLKREFCKS